MSKRGTVGIVLAVASALAGAAKTTPARNLCFQARQTCLYYRAIEGARVGTGIIERAAISLVLAGADARKMRCATPPSS
jgi:hypothetical protein